MLRRHVRLVVTTVLLVFVVLGVDATVRALDVVREVRAAATSVEVMRRSIGPVLAMDAAAWPNREGFAALARDVDDAHAHLARAQGRLGYLAWIAAAARPIPVWGEQIAAAPEVLDLGEAITAHTWDLLLDAAPLFTGGGTLTQRVRDVLVTRHGALDRDLAGLEAQAARAERLSRVPWSGPAARGRVVLAELAGELQHVSAFRQAASAASVGFDPFMGFQGRRTYIVLGQFTEQFNILQLAEFVASAATHLGIEAHIVHLPNPRVEAEAHYYNAVHTQLIDLGLEPHFLSDTLVESLMHTAIAHRGEIDTRQLPPRVDWRRASNDLARLE